MRAYKDILEHMVHTFGGSECGFQGKFSPRYMRTYNAERA